MCIYVYIGVYIHIYTHFFVQGPRIELVLQSSNPAVKPLDQSAPATVDAILSHINVSREFLNKIYLNIP